MGRIIPHLQLSHATRGSNEVMRSQNSAHVTRVNNTSERVYDKSTTSKK